MKPLQKMKPFQGLKQPRTLLVGAGLLCLSAGAVYAAMTMGHHGPAQTYMSVDAASRQQIIEQVASQLTDHYVFPDKGADMAQRLKQLAASGKFDRIDSAERLVDALTETLQDISHDKHLGLGYSFDALPEVSADGEPSAEQIREEAETMQRLNYGFETVGRLPFNIGYIDLHGFADPAKVGEKMAAAMALLSDTRALLIDLRKNHGGSPQAVAVIASYFFDKPTHLNDLYTREDGDKAQEFWTTETAGIKYGASRPVYLLTSSDTFSAGEDFTYAMKNTKRATLIGETTGGGAHPVRGYRINAHFEIAVPFARSESPITKTDWEGVGVVPDIAVKADKALNIAQIEILKARQKTETDPDVQDMIKDRIAELD